LTQSRIRWYGLTRSLDGGVTVEDANSPLTTSPAGAPPPAGDTEVVRPLWRYIQQLQGMSGTLPNTQGFNHLPFEKVGDGGVPAPMGGVTGGAGFPKGSPPYSGAAPAQYQVGYTCAWAPDDMHLDETIRTGLPYGILVSAATPNPSTGKICFPSRSMLPWLIRITVRLDDPNGRIPQGQQMQFIFKVNRPH
jgi:hypothetical protein